MSNVFSYIKKQLKIENVIRENARSLTETGEYLKCNCPFCDKDENLSMTVCEPKQIFYCFKCHIGGDVITFIANLFGMTQLEAAAFLEEKYEINIPGELLRSIKESKDEEALYFEKMFRKNAKRIMGLLNEEGKQRYAEYMEQHIKDMREVYSHYSADVFKKYLGDSDGQ